IDSVRQNCVLPKFVGPTISVKDEHGIPPPNAISSSGKDVDMKGSLVSLSDLFNKSSA
ncbi:4570_t:CDS:1, partial [Racocetra fulgida]